MLAKSGLTVCGLFGCSPVGPAWAMAVWGNVRTGGWASRARRLLGLGSCGQARSGGTCKEGRGEA